MPQYKLGTGEECCLSSTEHLYLKYLTFIQLEFHCSTDETWWELGNFTTFHCPHGFHQLNIKVLMELETTEGAILCDLHPWWQIYHHVGLRESKSHNLIATIHQVKHCSGVCVAGPPVCADIPVWLWLPVYVSGTLQWINFAAVGHHLGLSYSLCCTLPEPPLHFFFFSQC